MTKKRRGFATLDCETDPFKPGRIPQPFIWGFYDGNQFDTFTSTYECAQRVRGWDGRVYAHNGGRFDFHYLADYLDASRISIINGRLARARLGKAELRDSYLLLPTSLAQYQKSEIDYGLFEEPLRHLPQNRAAIVQYLRDDCVFLYEYLEAYFTEYPDSLTQAGAAMKIWRALGGTVPKSSARFYERYRRYYYGGRVEAITKGVNHGEFQIADIRSAYPYAMLHCHPIENRLPTVHRRVPDARLAHCLCDITARSHSALPHRDAAGGTRYPDGRYRFKVTGWEVIAALETGSLTDIEFHKAIEFSTYTTFKDYVDYFYAKKYEAEKRGDKANRLIAKLFLNSLYGKFAANPARYREYQISECDAELEGWRAGNFIGQRQLYSRPAPAWQHRYYNVATAASITGFVRAYLWLAMHNCTRVHYCDTDSVICDGTNNLRFGDQPGDWDLEAEPDKLAIAGKKLYAAWKDGQCLKHASKGVKLDPSEIERVARGEKITYNPEVPTFSLLTGTRFINRQVKPT